MIAHRHAWLLRDVATAFDYIPHGPSICRICRVSERGDIQVPRDELKKHLAAHRREKIAPREKHIDFLEQTG